MTVLWETERAGTRYSVRSHGASVRLYSNGVFHSQWNPERPFAGGVWDCLSLPVLYRERASVRRVLLLGVGGGAVIRQLESLVPFDSVTALEIDPVHLDVARRWFGVGSGDAPGVGFEAGEGRVTLIEGDAVQWLRSRCDEPFDLVIDDLFGHDEGEPMRARALTPDWVASLRDAARPGALIVVNCVDGRELRRAAAVFADEGLAHAQRWSLPGYENAIGVFSGAPLASRDWSRRLDASGLPTPLQRQARTIVRRPLRS